MNIKIGNEGKVTAVFFFENDEIKNIDEELKTYILEKKLFKGEKGEVFTDFGPNSTNTAIVGLGSRDDFSNQSLRMATYNLGKAIKKHKNNSVVIKFPYDDMISTKGAVPTMTEGLLQSEYNFDKYKSEKNDAFKAEFQFSLKKEDEKDAIEGIQLAKDIVEGVFLTRDLVNTPAIDMYPEVLANEAKEHLEKVGVKVDIYNKKEIEEMGMTAFLSVAEGSDKEPKFFVMKYLPIKNQQPLTFVGKGLTYDSGGYALKPAEYMDTMQSDMAGAASVIGAMYSIAKTNMQQNVVGVVAACENMVSGKAYKNGDIVKSMKGTTIEIKNTDAEGRVTLADSIYYAATKIDSAAIVDIATLTGACVVALGDYTTGMVSNNSPLANKIKEVSKITGEYVWEFPVQEELRKLLKGKVGDITNSTGRMGGAITAGLFLEEFVEKKPWVHMDIAGPSFSDKGFNYLPSGATGIPVKTLYQLANHFDSLR